MSGRRLIAIVLFAGWCGAVGYYWFWNVPLAATNWARKTPDSQPTTLNADEEMPMTHLRWADETRKRTVRCGPLEFWSFPECKKTREILTRDDEFIAGPLKQTREVMIRRAGRLVILNSESGETVSELPDLADARTFSMVSGKSQVLIQGEQDLMLFEFGREEPVWTAPQCTYRGRPVGDIVIVSMRIAGKSGFGSKRTTALRLATGEFDSRFDHLGSIGEIKFSDRGDLAIIRATPRNPGPGGGPPTASKTVVCDVNSGEVRWILPARMTMNGPMFWSDDQEVQGLLWSPGTVAVVRRWKASDGEPLPDPTPEQCAPLTYGPSPDGRHTLYFAGNEDSTFHRVVGRFNNFMGSHGFRFFINPNSNRVSVKDVATGRILGPLAANAANVWLPKDGGLISIDQNFIRYYRMPPGRDFWWLAMWAVLPPVGVVGLLRLWGRLRDRIFRRRESVNVTRQIEEALV